MDDERPGRPFAVDWVALAMKIPLKGHLCRFFGSLLHGRTTVKSRMDGLLFVAAQVHAR